MHPRGEDRRRCRGLQRGANVNTAAGWQTDRQTSRRTGGAEMMRRDQSQPHRAPSPSASLARAVCCLTSRRIAEEAPIDKCFGSSELCTGRVEKSDGHAASVALVGDRVVHKRAGFQNDLIHAGRNIPSDRANRHGAWTITDRQADTRHGRGNTETNETGL